MTLIPSPGPRSAAEAQQAPSGALPGALVAAGSVCVGAQMAGIASTVTLAVVFAMVLVVVVTSTLLLAAVAPTSASHPATPSARYGASIDRATIARHAVRVSLVVGAGVIVVLGAALTR